MPTYYSTARFRREFAKLTPAQRALFMATVAKFVDGLKTGRIRKSLRIKRLQGAEYVWELTWSGDGRALFRYGREVKPGLPHVEWLRVGGHEIFEREE